MPLLPFPEPCRQHHRPLSSSCSVSEPFPRQHLGSQNQVTDPERKLACHPGPNSPPFRFPLKHITYWPSCLGWGRPGPLGGAYLIVYGEFYHSSLMLIHQPLLFDPIKSKLLCQDHTWTAGREGQTGIRRSRRRPVPEVSQGRDAVPLALLTTPKCHMFPCIAAHTWVLPAGPRVPADRVWS